MSKRLWVWGGLIGVALAAVGGWWQWRGADAAVSYRTAKIERGALQASVAATGTVTPVTQVQVSSQVSGQIKELFVDFNSPVTQGQLIARLDPESFEYRLRQSTADVEASRASVLTAQANVLAASAQVGRAQVELQEAERDLERKLDLVKQNFISPAEADKVRALTRTLAESLRAAQAQVSVAQAQAQSAQAIVRQREAQLAQARVDLERTQIRSPVDGIIIKRSVEVGQTVAASLQAPELFVIAANLNDMQVETSIDEADIARVRNGQKVAFTIDAFPGRNFEGAVRQVRKAAVTAQNVTTYTVVVAFANPGSALLPGMTANVRIVTDTRENVLKVPNAALRVRIAGLEPVPAPGASAVPGARTGAIGGWSWLPDAQAQPAGTSGPARGTAAPASPATPAAPPPQGSGGPLREFRDRLISELKLDAAQVEKIDALLAETRPRFAELRNVPEDQRAKARERILAEMRVRISEQLTAAQRPRYQELLAEIGGRQSSRGRVYLLGSDGKPVAYNVRLGITDGVATELIVPPGTPGADALVEGATVITAVVTGAGPGARPSTPSGPRLPF